MEGVEVDGAAFEVTQKREVAPGRPQRGLGSGEPGAADDEAASLVDALGHHCLPTHRVVDGDPVRLGDRSDGCIWVLADPLRIRAWRISPVSARVARIGW